MKFESHLISSSGRSRWILAGLLILGWALIGSAQTDGQYGPKLPASMSPPVKMENILVEKGPFEPNWKSLQAYQVPQWFKDAKFGIWAHWGPQSAGEAGDWYAHYLYQDGEAQQSHIKKFGHPSEVGYMEVINAFKADQFDPEALMELYHRAGAQYFMAMGGHHDGVDCWNSKYQPWNTVRVGPHKDLVGLWHQAAEHQGMRFGVSFHSDFSWWWYQPAFLETEKTGPFAGVPYDAARLTKADGKGKWWDGLDPKDLYGQAVPEGMKTGIWVDPLDKKTLKYGNVPNEFTDQADLEYARWYCTKWTLRVQDIVHNYHPDLIYFDGTPYPFSGLRGGRGYASDSMERITADFYNTNIKEHGGKLEAVVNLKEEDLGNAILLDHESGFPAAIPAQAWQTDNTIGDWFYRPGCFYDAGMVIHELLEVVSRNGNLMMNVMLSPHGTLDPGGRKTLEEMAQWMSVNSEGIFGTHAWKLWGEGSVVMNNGIMNVNNARTPYSCSDFRFTQSRDNQSIYAFSLRVPGGDKLLDAASGEIRIKALSADSPLVKGEPAAVTLLGYGGKLKWNRTADSLVIQLPEKVPSKYSLCFKISGLTTIDSLEPKVIAALQKNLQQSPGFAAGPQGGFDLPAYVANLRGRAIAYEGEGPTCHIGNWSKGEVSWPIKVTQPGSYRVALEMATPSDGGSFVVEAGSDRLLGKTINTGGVDKYQFVEVGTTTFKQAGSYTILVSPNKEEPWKSFNLRSVQLKPTRTP